MTPQLTPEEFKQYRANLALALEKWAEVQYWPLATVGESLAALGLSELTSGSNSYQASYNLTMATAERIRGCETPQEVQEAYLDMVRQEEATPAGGS
jgi:hypothetical protein